MVLNRIDKDTAPFPTFDRDNPDHRLLALLGRRAEQAAATVDVSSATSFQSARKLIAKHLANTGIEADIVDAVTKLLLSAD